MQRMMIWLTILASLSACAVSGDFCDVVRHPLIFDHATARVMVGTDRPDVERIKVQNSYGSKNCDWDR